MNRVTITIDYDPEQIDVQELMNMLQDFESYVVNERGCKFDYEDSKLPERR